MFMICFNPLNRGNSNQIERDVGIITPYKEQGFNPLNRGNSNQIFRR